MTTSKNKGCGCASIPLSLIIPLIGGGYWWLIYQGNINKITTLLPQIQLVGSREIRTSRSSPISNSPSLPQSSIESARKLKEAGIKTQISSPITKPSTSTNPSTPWDRKVIRGIYLSRYQVTNNASEATIRQRVRYYHDRGINTIVHGVWGNGCTMYNSQVMQQLLGSKSCPNQFQDRWLEWTIDEAHQQGMQVHAYFEKGIKIDKNSPIFELANSKQWLVPGVDRTYAKVDHYVLDVDVPEVADIFKQMLAEFVTKYPKIDAVQWDDYLGYHAQLPGKIDRTASLTKFVRSMIFDMKAANPNVSFDLCHHNPYWAKRYFAADWQQWKVDRVFIQDYNQQNFTAELDYAVNYAGVAITDRQLDRLKELNDNPKIKSILIFPIAGNPEDTAARLQRIIQAQRMSKK